LAHEIRDAEARSVRERVHHERIGRRARRFVVTQVYSMAREDRRVSLA